MIISYSLLFSGIGNCHAVAAKQRTRALRRISRSLKHIAQKDEMMKIVADGINKILNNKIQEVDKVYDPACEKLSVQAEIISNYLQKVEKSLQRTNIVLENSKLEELLSVQKVIDGDIRMLQSERPQNLITSFQAQLDDTQSCLEMLCFHSTLRELADKCEYVYLFRFCANNGIIYYNSRQPEVSI
jgi:hypothetical protein